MIWLILGAAGALMLAFYIAAFMFVGGSSEGPGPNKGQNDFINQVCCPRTGIFATTYNFGYLKASFRRFCNYYRVMFFGIRVAAKGKPAPDAELLSLDGKPLSLLRDYISRMPQGMPLVLNMGSYT